MELHIKLKNSSVPVENYSARSLAYLGDAVFELFARSKTILEGNIQVGKLNRKTVAYVKATEQSKMYHAIIGHLTEEELAVLKRGRNAVTKSHAKSATVSEYRHATGLEALFGYLYLKGETERLAELFELGV